MYTINFRATSKTWSQTLDLEKQGINMGLKNMPDFGKFNEENLQCDL